MEPVKENLPEKKPANRIFLYTIPAWLIIGGAIGVYGTLKFTGNPASNQADPVAELRDKLTNAGLTGADIQNSADTIHGTISEIGTDYFLMISTTESPDPLNIKPIPSERRVVMAPGGEILLRTPKPLADFEAERELYNQELEANGGISENEEPLPYTFETISFADLKANMRIEVMAAEDILFSEVISATKAMVEESFEEDEVLPDTNNSDSISPLDDEDDESLEIPAGEQFEAPNNPAPDDPDLVIPQ